MDKAKLKLVVSTDPARNREINLQKLSDDDLMLRLKRNEYDAINELLDRYQPLVKGFITRYLGNSFLSSDITQEVFFYIWRERENYFPKNQFKSYLMKIVLNRCRYHSRQRNVAKGKIPQIENIYREKNDIATNPTDMWAAERAMYAQKILLELNKEVRGIFIMRCIHGFSYQEISQITQRPIGTLKTIVDRGLKRFLAKELENLS